jgi:hypothetical protein
VVFGLCLTKSKSTEFYSDGLLDDNDAESSKKDNYIYLVICCPKGRAMAEAHVEGGKKIIVCSPRNSVLYSQFSNYSSLDEKSEKVYAYNQ